MAIEETFLLGHDRRWMAEVSRRAGARLGRLVDPPWMLKAGNDVIPFWNVRHLGIENVEQEIVTLTTFRGETYTAEGFDAIEAVMALKPSLLEGRRLKWRKGAWAWHNCVGHPLMQLLAWIGMPRLAIRVHDLTTPRPRQRPEESE